MKRKHPQAGDFTVGWISALPVELTAATEMLDEVYDDSGDTTQYTLGRIGRHNIAVMCLPAGGIGTNSAATAAAEMRLKFPALQIGLVVGIGGGVPNDEADIRLGDVVISQPQGPYGGVVQYDFGKTGSGGQHTRLGHLNRPPNILLTAVSKLRSNRSAGKSNIPRYLSSLAHLPEFNRRSAGPDNLFHSSYRHVGGPTCDGCCKDMVVIRSPRESEDIVIHYGTIASGNQVMKDGLTRDKLSTELGGVLCFEMEAAGLMNSFPCLVIRGICDYADSHKNKKWQPFAAGAAAACAKEILSLVSPASWQTPSIQVAQDYARSHTEINRPHGPDDLDCENFVRTRNQVAGATQNVTAPWVRSVLPEDQRKVYLDSLKFDQIDARHATIKTAHAKTCRWLLSKGEYQDWLNVNKLPEHYGFLWIKGKPATGKSTIMKFAYAHAKKEVTDAIIISFFFNARGEELEKSTLGMYRSLLFQLLEKLPDLQDVFDFLRPTAAINGVYRWDIETIKSLFEQSIEQLGQRRLICFIDALDECEEDQIREMVSFFEQLGQLAVSSQCRFHVCFSSRHYPHITIGKSIQLILESQEGHQQDIANYLHSQLKAGQSKLVEQIKSEILERASGIFLWVVLVVQMLNKEYDRGRIYALRKRLDEIPNGLDELFQDILTRDGQNVNELILCLQCILYAKRPLKREELYFAIVAGVEPEAVTAWSSDEITKEDMERFILDSSKGLAEMTKSKVQTVQFIHESVRDFLLKGNGLDRLQTGLRSNFPGRSHERLKQCCENYMTIDTSQHLSLTAPLPSASSEPAANLRRLASEKFPFLEYAVQNILHHADAADSYGIPQDVFVKNFTFSKWITLDNLFERYEIRRHTPDASQLYILAGKNLPNLIRIILKEFAYMDINREHDGYQSSSCSTRANDNATTTLLEPVTGVVSGSDLLDNHSLCQTSTEDQGSITNTLTNRHNVSLPKDQSLLSQKVELSYFGPLSVSLATAKVDINCRTRRGLTPLSRAAEKGHEVVVELLIDKGADLEAKDKSGRTPLHSAAVRGHESVVKLLVEKGANCHSAQS
ncbi:hypothetical protein VTN00DRAFT_5192 [Thermoascus crustaceus]|uniref:uncharacterized protein n=1 Tax=Thermoascus crustaceus TaxID=5088 RepID=UPI0037438F2C